MLWFLATSLEQIRQKLLPVYKLLSHRVQLRQRDLNDFQPYPKLLQGTDQILALIQGTDQNLLKGTD